MRLYTASNMWHIGDWLAIPPNRKGQIFDYRLSILFGVCDRVPGVGCQCGD
jgi:hypothetical protein